MSKTEIELQHFHGCPNGPKLLETVLEAIKVSKREVNFRELLVDTPDKAKASSFRGSPTLLINGADFEGLPAPDDPMLSCRLYPQGLPDIKAIVERIDSL